MDVKASEERIAIHLKEKPQKAIKISLDGERRLSPGGQKGSHFTLSEPGVYTCVKVKGE